ncbi:MAG: response regulator [bacterium]
MSKKIILGSSSITILKEVEWNLTDSDYEIMPANDLDDFYELVKSKNPDLLIIDRDMQDGNGISLCKELKSSNQYARFPVILLVKKTDEESQESMLALEKECKADRVLAVPLETSKFLSTVQYHFARQSAASDPLTQNLGSQDEGISAPESDNEIPEKQSPFDETLLSGEPLLSEELTGGEIDLGEVTPVSEASASAGQSPFEWTPLSEDTPQSGEPSYTSKPGIDEEPSLSGEPLYENDLTTNEEMALSGERTLSEEPAQVGDLKAIEEPSLIEEPLLSEELSEEELELGGVNPVSEAGTSEERSPFDEDTPLSEEPLLSEESSEEELDLGGVTPVSEASASAGQSPFEGTSLSEDTPQSGEPSYISEPGIDEEPSLNGEPLYENDLTTNEEPALSGESSQVGDPTASEEPSLSEESLLSEEFAGEELDLGGETPVREEGTSAEQSPFEGTHLSEDMFQSAESTLSEEPLYISDLTTNEEPASSGEGTLGGEPSQVGDPTVSEEPSSSIEPPLSEELIRVEPDMDKAAPIRDAGISEKPHHDAMPSLSAEAALAETIRVVEEAVKRTKLIQEKAFHEKSLQTEPSKDEIDQEEISQSGAFNKSVQGDFFHDINFAQTESSYEKTSQDSEKTETWQKHIFQEQMNKLIEESVPEMTKKLVQEQMSRVIEESIPEMTKKLVQEQIAKVVDDKMLAKMIVDEIDQNREVVSKLLADAAPNIITKAVERMVPELAEKIIRDEIEHIKHGSGSG